MLLNKFFYYPAPVIVYTGIPESGKTDNALWLSQKALEYGFIDICASNMQIVDDRFLQLTSLRSLEKWLALFRNKRKLFILDEADSCMTNLDIVSKLSKEFRVPMAFQIRKYHAKLILIYHRLRDVPELYLDRNVTMAFIFKLNKYNALIKSDLLYPLIGESTLKLTNVPRTNIPFRTFGIGEFTLENKKEMEMLDLWYKTMILKKHGYEEEQIKIILKEVAS
jgi:hypothetical protein